MSLLKHVVSRTLFRIATAVTLATLHAAPALAVTAFGVTSGNELVSFDTAAPGTVVGPIAVTGLQVGEQVLAIDVRPLTAQLYALGSTSRLYVIETATGAATEVGSSSFVVPLAGTAFGFDFDPVADRIRVVSDARQNLRLDPDTGTVVDSDPGTAGVQPDASLPGGSSVVACAYTNNVVGAATTTLFGIDSASDMLVRLGGPDGAPSPDLGGVTPIGDLGRDVANVAGLDIGTNGERAYAVLKAPLGPSHLYAVDLALGSTTDLGIIGDGTVPIRDLAVLSRPVTIFGVTGANELVRFDSLRPDLLLGTTAITGLEPGEQILGIDARPANGRLFGLGSTSRLYTIDTRTGAATQVGFPFDIPLDGTAFGFDFNPVSDRIRIVSDTGQNFRVNPDTAAQIDSHPDIDGVQLDGELHPPGTVVGSAYTNAFAGALKTTLFGINAATDRLVRQGGPDGSPSPSGGAITSIGLLGVDTTSMVGFDISPIDATAFASLTLTVGGTSGLYTIDLGSGAATSLGVIGAQPIRGIAIAPPGRFQFAASTFTASENADAATVTIIRTEGSNGPASVRFTASSGTATAGADFEGVSATLVFLDDETSRKVDVPLIDDGLVEGPETVTLTLGGASTGLGAASTAVLTIEDDDGAPPPVACTANAECDDRDRCTTDACVDGACTNALSARFETVLCELDTARRASLCGDDPVRKKLVRTIRRLIVRTGRLVQRAAAGKKRAAGTADTVLASIQAKAKKAVQDIKLSRPCGRVIDQRVQGIRDLLLAATPAASASPRHP
jgi:hypothetical protein